MDQDSSRKTMPQDAKGKGVDRGSMPSPLEHDSPSDSAEGGSNTINSISILSRLGASTSKLANDMILRHSGGAYVADGLPSDKAGSSRTRGSPGANEAPTYKNNPAQDISDGTFYSTRIREQQMTGESDFSAFLDNMSMPEAAEPRDMERFGDEESYQPECRQASHSSQTAAISATDGMDVVRLLDSGYDEVEETAMFLSDNERIALRHRLFDQDETRGHRSQRGQWEDALNFFPSSRANSDGIQEYANLLGVSNLKEATTIWIEQWQQVLSSYTDQVWGDLSPLVREAREELVTLSNPRGDASPSRPKALRRLQQILSHVRGS
ncbi:hypothetical protein F4677DRAFT_428517 [Hypoxylon crocopeplum]|nr:hypothetical protein F4677DRAFT_428517 [Hypoxylon crocopeplum]